MTQEATLIDVRTIPPRERHPLLLATFRGLALGDAMEMVNDHDPLPLYDQFQARQPGGFGWEYLERGPHTWHVRITRQDGAAVLDGAPRSCCGGCCGS